MGLVFVQNSPFSVLHQKLALIFRFVCLAAKFKLFFFFFFFWFVFCFAPKAWSFGFLFCCKIQAFVLIFKVLVHPPEGGGGRRGGRGSGSVLLL
jgi:hypothetical protein